MSTREEWVRVKSESELRPGMPVKRFNKDGSTTCETPLGTPPHLIFLVEKLGGGQWRTLDPCPWDSLSVGICIREGRLYRLSDLTDDSDTTVATKELVMT